MHGRQGLICSRQIYSMYIVYVIAFDVKGLLSHKVVCSYYLVLKFN